MWKLIESFYVLRIIAVLHDSFCWLILYLNLNLNLYICYTLIYI